ncbi:Rha family transcriptional regulator [Turicibacter sanguinis]|uniref:Rha family transcriptional regulator n=1 Tax=Turicibacter sanguinis TaxID=154288 RepID=UPI0018AA5B43|nr:Rha family transcriptional regulator [Turicibacter sanguinis]MDB8552951.1 ORF6C domain-containing protein [Turicibacter sanguinis]
MSNINITPFYSKGYENAEAINIQNKDGVAVVSSRVVAYDFDKQHHHVTQAIENFISENSLLKNMFIESTYKTDRGRTYKEYLLTRDGFSLLVMGFTGKEALQWKLQYIEAFNKMEEYIKQQQSQVAHSPMDILKVMFSALEEQKQDIVGVKQEVQNFKEEMPIFTPQRKEISKRVRALGVKLLGGKKSPAYQDKSLRSKVYSDINGQIHREFGVESCDDIKRKDYSAVFSIIHNYSLPMHLLNDIDYANSQMSLDV